MNFTEPGRSFHLREHQPAPETAADGVVVLGIRHLLLYSVRTLEAGQASGFGDGQRVHIGSQRHRRGQVCRL
jgi:hypothetical protein